ncbi:MAG TPA: ECF transporter S component [bacterium]|nr:ECF transporter S component [bacterium]
MNVRLLVLVGMLGAAAFILMATIQIPILPSAPYLRYDPSDMIGLIAAFLAGPAAGVAVIALKDALYLLFRARSIFGPLANFLAVATFVGVAGWVLRGRPLTLYSLLGACAAGGLARVLLMIPANFIILNLQLGMPASRVAELVWPVIIPFNTLASVINTALTAIVLLAVRKRGVTSLMTYLRDVEGR